MTAAIAFGALASDVAQFGGKAAALARLASLGFDVPAFFAIDAALFNGAGAPDISAALDRLGTGPYAVRSSGRDEDGTTHSHAGQFLSILNVARNDVAAAAQRVWLSGQTDSLKAYRASRGLDTSGGAPAVIVQRMVAARAAGVAFSADPVSGRRDRIIISAIAGLADRLAGGEEDGEQYSVDAASGAIVAGPGELRVLSASDIAALRELVQRVADSIGVPQDIEWAFEGERLYLLQSRAITTALRAPLKSDDAITIFDNSNIVESYPGFVSPLTYSFAQYAYARVYRAFLTVCGVDRERIHSNSPALENMLGRIDGRVYYNLINWYKLLALLPGFSLNRGHMESMMGVGEPLPKNIADALAPPPAKGIAAVSEWARVAGMAIRLTYETIRLPRTIARFYDRLNRALATGPIAINAMSLSALAAHYRRIEADLLDRWDAPLINDFLCMIAFGSSRKLMERWLGDAGLQLHNDVMIGQGDIISAEPPQRIARMGRLIAHDPELIAALARGDRLAARRNTQLDVEISAYIAKFGDRCTEELKLESITLDDNPAPLLASIAAAAANTKPDRKRHDGNGMDSLDTLLAGKPFKRLALKRLLGWAKARVRDRENLRFERTRIFGHARRVLLAMGRQLNACDRLDHPRDIFFLTVPELLGAIEGFSNDRNLKGLVALRTADFAIDRATAYPGDRITIRGAVIAQSREASAAQPVASGTELKGTGCSAGIITAKARVIRDPNTEKLERGEVLVAQHTDPGWIALFTNASAIVVERGSLLSHSAIVARELGIPCVVGLKGAMTAIATGETIEVDGASGRVRKTA